MFDTSRPRKPINSKKKKFLIMVEALRGQVIAASEYDTLLPLDSCFGTLQNYAHLMQISH